MMTTYNRIRLAPEAIEYIKDRLADGKTLARFLLEKRDLNRGEVVTFLPPYANLERIGNFSWGGVLPTPPSETHQHYTTPDGTKTVMVPVPNTRPHLVWMIQEFLKQGEGQLCLFESAVASPTYGFLASPDAQDLRVLTFEDDVYYLLTEDDLDLRRIEKTVRYATSYLVIGVLARLPQEENFLPVKSTRATIVRSELELLAQRTEKIIVGAYDGEGYLIWSSAELSEEVQTKSTGNL